MTGSGTIAANPNPVTAAGGSGLGITTLSWTSQGVEAVEVRTGAPDGPLVSRTGGSGSITTGRWVRDGMVFYLQDVSAGKSLAPENTLATVSVAVLRPVDRSGPKALILMYHRVAQASPDPWSLCVTPTHFTEQLEVLCKQAQVLSLEQLVKELQEGRLSNRPVAVTFDDGYADNLHNAKPLLERYGVPATLFVVSGSVGSRREFWWDELEQLLLNGSMQHLDLFRSLHSLMQPLRDLERRSLLDGLWKWIGAEPVSRLTQRSLSAAELSEIARGGLIEIGAHTRTHAFLPALAESEQRVEIERSKSELENMLGRSVDHFAYPYGGLTEITAGVVQNSGFMCACTTSAGLVDRYADRFQLPRFMVQNWDGDEFSTRLEDWCDDQGASG